MYFKAIDVLQIINYLNFFIFFILKRKFVKLYIHGQIVWDKTMI